MSAVSSSVASRFSASVEELLADYARSGDRRVWERAFEQSMPLARRLASRYHHGWEPMDDLLQVAYAALAGALNRFDPMRGTSFAAFAQPTIAGELRRHFRDTSWAIHIPRAVQEHVLAVRKATGELTTSLGRSPRVSELVKATGLDSEQIAEALDAHAVAQVASLDRPVGIDEDDSTLADVLGADDSSFDLVDDRASIGRLMRTLPRQEREMLGMRFVCDMTQTEIATRVGCSQMHVSRVLRRALDRLRAAESAA